MTSKGERERAEDALARLGLFPGSSHYRPEAMHAILRDERARCANMRPAAYVYTSERLDPLEDCESDGYRKGIAAYRNRIRQTL